MGVTSQEAFHKALRNRGRWGPSSVDRCYTFHHWKQNPATASSVNCRSEMWKIPSKPDTTGLLEKGLTRIVTCHGSATEVYITASCAPLCAAESPVMTHGNSGVILKFTKRQRPSPPLHSFCAMKNFRSRRIQKLLC